MTRPRTKPRPLGKCYVCGKMTFGYRAINGDTLERREGVMRDINGIRHGGCLAFKPSGTVTPSDS